MFLIVKLLVKELMEAEKAFHRDPRMSYLPLLGSPWPMVFILVLYLFFVKVWGPRLMRNREPYDVKTAMQCYNVCTVLINVYVCIFSIYYSYWQPHFKASCQEYDTSDMRESNLMLRYPAYVYYISKYLDMLDTIFFVLRKKYNQITFLHVYHHSIMIYGVWVYCTLLFASHYTMAGAINSFIHVCMYSYYFVAALKLDFDLTPWKRRMTQLQILQFCYLTFHFARPIFNNHCQLDPFWVWVSFIQNLFMLLMFCDFYYTAYIVKDRRRKKALDAAQIHSKPHLAID